MNPLRKLQEAGQAAWLDFIHRGLLTEGGLTRLIEEDGVAGVTSNPSIFQQAIAAGSDYDAQIAEVLAAEPRAGAGDLYERLAVADIRTAADQLRGVWDSTGGADGYVSLEVSPYLAHDAAATVEEARRLWRAVDRPNLMIKVPGTAAGVPAFETLIGEGINVNVTLMFSLATYEAVAQAYLRGLGRAADPSQVASVASFFVSRVDSAADAALERIGTAEALALRGRTAIANAKLAYRRFEEIFRGAAFAPLAARGARPQRVLWASTSTKNPAYRDVIYVEELIGAETVNTLPPATLEAFRDHGEVRPSLTESAGEAAAHLERLAAAGVDLDAITDKLQRDGVEAFAASFDTLLAAVEGKRGRMLARRVRRPELRLGELRGVASRRLQQWQDERFTARLWARDVSLFAPAAAAAGEWPPEVADRLGWLALPESMTAAAGALAALAAEVAAEGTRDVVVLGMGGSSLAPEVFGSVLGGAVDEGRRRPRLSVLDTTHPTAVRAAFDRLDPAATLYVVSSKSGTTVETDALFRAAWERAAGAVAEPGHRFVAVTDPGTPLARLAGERGFRCLFTAPPDVGGRYSALTPFGLVPAALAGADVGELLDRAFVMAQASGPGVPEMESPALALGAAIAAAAAAGRDKLTLLTSPALASFPDWIEQLVAESLGKDGRGVVPVVGEPLGAPASYGDDRLFVAVRLEGDAAAGLADLAAAGHPVVEIVLGDRYDLGAEMLRWELATAAAAEALGVQPFDQPDVELAKKLARAAMAEEAGAAGTGSSAPAPIDAADEQATRAALDEWLAGAAPGGYLAIQAFLAPTAETAEALDALRRELGTRTRAAVTAGWGPRFLHSTGQLHKGGPEGGRFLQLVDRPSDDLPVPGADFTFGRLIRAQAAGDAAALARRGLPVLRLDLGADPASALRRLTQALAAVAA
jgi:transaldolase/glucose-6-phosphate isomerase